MIIVCLNRLTSYCSKEDLWVSSPPQFYFLFWKVSGSPKSLCLCVMNVYILQIRWLNILLVNMNWFKILCLLIHPSPLSNLLYLEYFQHFLLPFVFSRHPCYIPMHSILLLVVSSLSKETTKLSQAVTSYQPNQRNTKCLFSCSNQNLPHNELCNQHNSALQNGVILI